VTSAIAPLKQILDWSGTLPLDIRLQVNDIVGRHTLLEMLGDTSNRWRSAYISAPDGDVRSEDWIPWNKHGLPILERAYVTIANPTLELSILNAETLHTAVIIWNPSWVIPGMLHGASFPHIRHLKVQMTYWEELPQMFPNVETLDLVVLSEKNAPTHYDTVVELPASCRELVLDEINAVDVCPDQLGYISTLRAPSIKKLTIRGQKDIGAQTTFSAVELLWGLTKFVKDSGCKLACVRFENIMHYPQFLADAKALLHRPQPNQTRFTPLYRPDGPPNGVVVWLEDMKEGFVPPFDWDF
jgi:hypothetical protein